MPCPYADLRRAALQGMGKAWRLSPADREEIVQEAILRTLQMDAANPLGAAVVIGRRLAIDYWRHLRRVEPVGSPEPVQALDEPQAHVEHAHDASRLLALLPPGQRAAVLTWACGNIPAGPTRGALYKLQQRGIARLRTLATRTAYSDLRGAP